MQRKRTLRKAIYHLKRAYGFQVTLCRPQNTSFDFETGVESNVTSFKIINRAILLPSELRRSTKGVEYSYAIKEMLLDWQDIKIIGIEINDIILFNNESWRVAEVDDYELNTMKWAKIKHVVGAPHIDPLNPNVSTLVAITQGVVNE